jgi:hypothetical protein
MSNRIASVALALCVSLAAAAPAGAQITPGTALGTFVGPSSTQTPYVVPTAPGWETIAVISAGDPADNGYRMVGIPDGLGALPGRFKSDRYVADEKYLTVFMNHEIPAPNGIVRAHGQNSAFVSRWTIRLNSLQVRFGEDLIQNVFAWDAVNHMYVTASATERQFSRFCSADLPASTAFFNPRTGKGFGGRLFMNGEESGNEGRAFAHVLTGHDKGSSYHLASLGRFSWENSVAHPHAGDKTIVVGLDDSTPGQVYVYVGDKKSTGNAVERAGLVGGRLSGIQVTNGGASYGNGPMGRENNGPINGTFQLVDVSDVAVGPGATLQATSAARHISEFARPEDGAWDTRDPRVFYFVVTGASIDGQGQSARLYKLRLDSIANPTGGTIELSSIGPRSTQRYSPDLRRRLPNRCSRNSTTLPWPATAQCSCRKTRATSPISPGHGASIPRRRRPPTFFTRIRAGSHHQRLHRSTRMRRARASSKSPTSSDRRAGLNTIAATSWRTSRHTT